MDLARNHLPGSVGEYFWGGAAATAFWIDPKEHLAVVFMTQVMDSEARLTLRRDLGTLVYAAISDWRRNKAPDATRPAPGAFRRRGTRRSPLLDKLGRPS
jgi:CubicO group peptidase (beta-lactamase class C family)